MSFLQERVYVSYVNLNHRTDRLASIKEQLALHDIEATRTPGVYPHERTEEKSKMIKMLQRKQVGALGCMLAQIDIMKAARNMDMHAWVLEDDTVMCQDIHRRLANFSSFLNDKDWDVAWLGGTVHIGGNGPYWHKTFGRDAECTPHPHILKTYGAFSTYSYIVNRSSLNKVITLLESSYPWTIGIDYSFIKLGFDINSYMFVPGCCKQIDNLSDQVPGSGDWTTFSNFSKLGPYWYADWMDDFDPRTYDWKEGKI